MYFFRHWELVQRKSSKHRQARGGAWLELRVAPAGLGGREVRCVGSSGSRQGVALPARGHGSLSAVALPALHIRAELTAPAACSP